MAKFQEPRWISTGQESPLAAMAGMVAGARDALMAESKAARRAS